MKPYCDCDERTGCKGFKRGMCRGKPFQMSTKQASLLHTIIGKLEHFQHLVADPKGRLSEAKSRLIAYQSDDEEWRD